jgi:hypothetical protein
MLPRVVIRSMWDRRRAALLSLTWCLAAVMVHPFTASASLPLNEQTLVSDVGVGSSNPTAFANNRRVAVTSGGRVLVVHGYHAKGVMLKWRDGTGPWNPLVIYSQSTTGDWPASIAIETDSTGKEFAWIVFSGDIFSNTQRRPVYMRRLRNLHAAGGPLVGPLVRVEGTSQDGNDPAAARPDIAFETASNGSKRGVIVWTRANIAANDYALMTKWFTDLDTDTPTFSGEAALFSGGSNRNITGTLVSTPAGVRVVARTDALRVYAHGAGAPLDSWTTGSAKVKMGALSRAGAVALSSGEILAAAEVNRSTHTVKVVRFSNTGSSVTTPLSITGYQVPTIASDGTRAWVVMVRSSDRLVVSREFSGTAWTAGDRIEVNSAGGGDRAWPNLLREVKGRMVFIVQGNGSTTSKKVWGITRSV